MQWWNKYTEEWLSQITRGLKQKRVKQFISKLKLGPNDIILDLGSEDGSYLAANYPYPHNIVIADLNEDNMKYGVEKYGLKGYQVIPEKGELPFTANQFDAVWCNSVIEHVTVSENERHITNRSFKHYSNAQQRLFADEIKRIGKKYFVQTPYLHFPVEAHSWLPLVQYLPQRHRRALSHILKKVWIKQWSANYYLYDIHRFRGHFADASIFYVEKICGIPKSIIVIRQ